MIFLKKNKIKVYIYKDHGEKIVNNLFRKRLKRYNEAIRTETQRKLIVGSQVSFEILRLYNLASITLNQVFEKSAHELKELPFHVSFANSDKYYVLAISGSPIGVDIEILKDRNCTIYDKFLGKKYKNMKIEEKKEYFYKKWLEKEASIKNISHSTENKMFYQKMSELVLGLYGLEDSIIEFVEINSFRQVYLPIKLEED